jgi:hypothetical protein
MIISGVLADFPLPAIRDSDLLEGQSLVSLYRTVEALIERFQQMCDEILQVLLESDIAKHFYGSARNVREARLPAANRRLRSIAFDMRELAGSLDGILKRESTLRSRLNQILQVCASISVAEDFLVVNLGTPAAIPDQITYQINDDGRAWGPWTGEMHPLNVEDNINSPDYPGKVGQQMVSDFRRVLGELDRYKRELRQEVAKVVAEGA